MRQILLFIPQTRFGSGGRGVPLAEKPFRVWTAMPNAEPKLPCEMVHLQNGFLEDSVHDWNWAAGTFRFYSRLTEGDCWLVLEYSDAPKRGRGASETKTFCRGQVRSINDTARHPRYSDCWNSAKEDGYCGIHSPRQIALRAVKRAERETARTAAVLEWIEVMKLEALRGRTK